MAENKVPVRRTKYFGTKRPQSQKDVELVFHGDKKGLILPRPENEGENG
jgi:hypothetical protein